MEIYCIEEEFFYGSTSILDDLFYSDPQKAVEKLKNLFESRYKGEGYKWVDSPSEGFPMLISSSGSLTIESKTLIQD